VKGRYDAELCAGPGTDTGVDVDLKLDADADADAVTDARGDEDAMLTMESMEPKPAECLRSRSTLRRNDT
jgi:hypothetical protein